MRRDFPRIIIFALVLIVFSIMLMFSVNAESACTHWNTLIVYAKREASSTQHGNIAYCFCENCQNYFYIRENGPDFTKELEPDDLILHYYPSDGNYDLTVPGNDGMKIWEATCQRGNVYLKKCKHCDTYSDFYTYEDDVRADHTPADLWIVPDGANCLIAGFIRTKQCSVCGETVFTEEVTKQRTHADTLNWPEKPATCTAPGRNAGAFCSLCYQPVIGGEIIPPLPHHIVVAVKGYPSTCYSEGRTDATTCTMCNTQYTPAAVIPKIPHMVGIPATCVNGAICKACGQEFGDKDFDNHAGNIDIFKAEVPATCTSKGQTAIGTCKACGKIAGGEDIPMLSHTQKTAANCVDKAVCKTCGQSYGAVDPNNHKSIVKDAAKPATCISTGLTEGSHCEACKKTIKAQETVPLAAHTPTMENKAATCTEDGVLNKSVCSVCKVVLDPGTVLPKTGHKWGNWTLPDGFTCAAGGAVSRVCSVCKLSEVQIQTPKAHIPVQMEVVSPTCEKQGYTSNRCSFCGQIYKSNIVEPRGHDWGKWKTFQSSESDEEGIEVRFCKSCGAYELREAEKPSQNDDEKPAENLNFFQRIIQWFRNLFAKLFGKKK